MANQNTPKKIGILTSGGDAPGMNAAIRAVTRTALNRGIAVAGIYRGYSGLIDGSIRNFQMRDVSNIVNHGGTILYSDRCAEFATEPGMQKAIATCRTAGIDGIVAIGGDGTFRGACDLTNHGIPCIGLPGTIDNDITCTDYTIGFDTAVNTTVEMVDRLRDTCESHARCNVVEVMGRNAGHIALHAGIATGAATILIPEIPFDEDEIIRKMIEGRKDGKRQFIVMVSEGIAGYAEKLAKILPEKTGIETRYACLGHVVRGGSPTLRDRLLGAEMGAAAVDCLLEGKSNLVICERDDRIVPMDINLALILDRLYKDTSKPGELEALSRQELEEIYTLLTRKRSKMYKLYNTALEISK